MGRIVVKGGGKISGSRSKYVASSKISENEKRVRKLFSEVESELTYTQADNHLSGGKGSPRDNELLELIVSVHRDRYLRLGTTAEERESNFKNSIREGLSLLWEEMGVENVRYVAGLHQNTDAPHTHILIWRGAQNAETGEPQIINVIPRSWIYGTKKENSKIGKIFDEIFNKYSLPQLPKFTLAILSSENILLPARDTNAVRSESAINALIEQRYISPEIIESLQDSGAVYANRQGSLTYVRRDGSGVITGYESETGFGKTDDEGFFYIGEPQKATHFVVVENPKELLSLLELTSHRNLAEVCFVAADRKQSPKAFTELLKTRANENSMRVVWALKETGNKESIAPFEKLQNELLESRKPNVETTLEFYTFTPKLKFGKTWHQQILWRELPGQAAALRTEVRRVGTTELLIENSDVAEAYETLSNEVFSRLTVEKIGDEFVVYDRENQTEKGRYQWELSEAENNFTITSINGIPALTNFKENELHFTDEIETLNLLEDYSLRLQNQNFLNAIDTTDDKYELENNTPQKEDESDRKADKSEVVEAELKPGKEVLNRAEAFERAKEATRKLKEIPLEEILSMHGLGLVKDKERQEWVYKDAGNKFKIKVTGNLFSDRYDDRRGGKGAIKLWEHLNNCDFPTARSEMFEHFGATYVPSEKTSKLKTVETAIETEKKNLVLPPPNRYNEQIIRTYLIEERKMSAAVVNYLMDGGDVYANSYKSVVFLHRNLVDKSITGASWRATQGTKRQDVAGSDKNKGWFHLGNFETANRFIITESPIEAISYFELHKHDDLSGTLILASGGNHVSLNLFRLIEEKAGQNAEIVMAFNNDKGGQSGHLNALEKTGSYVLLRHKNAYLAGEIETVEFTGIVSLEVPVSDDWNEDLKQYREESFAEAEIEHIVEEVNQNAEPFLIQISTKRAGKKHMLYLDEAFAEKSDFLINAINNGFFADYTNALIETEELASIDDFDIAAEKDTNAVLMVTDSHLAGIEKAVSNERRLIENPDFKLAELYGKGIEKFLRRSDERYNLSLEADAIENNVEYTIESLASEDVFYLSVPTDTGSLWSVGINRRIESQLPPNNFRFEKHVFEGNLRDSLKFIQDQDGKVFDELAYEEIKTKTVESNPQGILAGEVSITERAGGAPSIEKMRLEAPPIALSILTKQIAEKGYGKDITFELFAVDDRKPETILVLKNEATKQIELGRIVVAENLSFNFSESISKDVAEIQDSLKLDEISGKVIDAYKRASISSSLTDPPTPGQIIKNQLIDVLPMDAPAFDIVSPEETTGYIVTDKNHNRLFGFFEEEGGFITLSTQTNGNGGYSAEAGQTFPDYESLSETFSVLLDTLPKFAETPVQPDLAKKNGDIPEQDNIEDQQNENKAKDGFSVPEDSDLHNLLKILPDEVKPLFDEPVGFVTLKNEYFVNPINIYKRENQIEVNFDLEKAEISGLASGGYVGYTFSLENGEYEISSADILYSRTDDPANDASNFYFHPYPKESTAAFKSFWLDFMGNDFGNQSIVFETNVQKVAAACVEKYQPTEITGKHFTVEQQERITRKNVRDNLVNGNFYLFGDNLKETGFGGQAAEMRGEVNAIGIPTKKSPSMNEEAFFTDTDLLANRKMIDKAFAQLAFLPENSTIVIPTAGLGTGLAKLEASAPQTLNYLNERIRHLSAHKTYLRYLDSQFAEFTPIAFSSEYSSDENLLASINGVLYQINAEDKQAFAKSIFSAATDFYNSRLGTYSSEEIELFINQNADNSEPSWKEHFIKVLLDEVEVKAEQIRNSQSKDRIIEKSDEDLLDQTEERLLIDLPKKLQKRANLQIILLSKRLENRREWDVEINAEFLEKSENKKLDVSFKTRPEAISTGADEIRQRITEHWKQLPDSPEKFLLGEILSKVEQYERRGNKHDFQNSFSVPTVLTDREKEVLLEWEKLTEPGREEYIDITKVFSGRDAVDRGKRNVMDNLLTRGYLQTKQIDHFIPLVKTHNPLSEEVQSRLLKNENDLFTVDEQAVLSAENPVIKINDSQAADKLDTKIAIAAAQYQTQLTEIETRFNEIFVYAKPGEQFSQAEIDLPKNSDVTIVGFDESRSVILYSFNDTDHYGVASVSNDLKTYDHSFFDKVEFDKIQETFVYQFDQNNKLKKADENVLSATSLANDIENSDPSLADLLADGKFEETGLNDISEAETFPPIPPIDLELYERRMSERHDFDPEDENILSPDEVRQDYFEEVLGTAREILELTDFVAAAPQTKKAEQQIKKGNERLNRLQAELPVAIKETGFYFGEPSEKYIKSVVKSTGITFDDNYKLQIADKDFAGQPLKLTESSPIKELSGSINESAVAKLALMLHNQSDADEFTYPGEDIRRVSISLPEKIKPFVNAAALVAFPERTGTDAHIGFRLNLGGEVYQHLPNMLDVAERRGSKALGEAADQIREIVKLKWQAAGSPVFHENAFKTEEVTPEMAFAFALDAVEKFERATGGRYDFAPCLAVNREFSDETYKYLNLWEEQTKDNGEKYAELFKVFPKNPANPDLFSENADARRVLNDLIYAGYIEIEQENDKGLFIKTGNPLLISPDSKESDIRNDESTLSEASENDLKTVESVLNKLNLLDKINSNEDFSERIEVDGLNPLYISREGNMLDLAIYFPDQESVEINYLLKLSVSENGGVRFDEFGFRTSAKEDIDRKTLHDDITIEAGKFINDVLIKYEEGVLFVGEAAPVKEPKVELVEVKKESETEIIWKPRPVNLNLIAGIADKSERERHYEIYKDLSRESAVLLTLLQKENNGTIPDSIDPHNLSDKLYFTVRRVGNLYRFTGKKGEDTEVIRIAKEFTYQETAKIAKGKIEEFPVTNPKPETTTLVIATPEVKIKPEKTPESYQTGSGTSDNSRSLLLPEVVDLTVDEQQSYHENKELLAMRGYQTLALSGKTIAIKAIPSTVTPDECKDDFIFLLNNPERIVEQGDIIQGIPVEPISIEAALAAWSKPEIQTLRLETAPPIPASAEESRTNEKDHSEHYRWTDPELHNASALQRLRWNIQAIELLRHLNAEYRAPEVEEQDTLARFSGWGSMKPVFDPTQQDKWMDETESLKRLLSESEFQAAESATLNSHFTSPTIVDALWQTAVRLGFRGGKAVEPSVGIGVVLGRIPEHLIPVTKFTAIEKDELTAKLCTKLYLDVVVKHSGYEDHRVPDGWYDLAIGNVPFGSYKVHDERYNKLNANIHDYFLVKSLDQIRGGGIQILITSAGTLDKADDSIRRRIAKEGKLIGAMRLPSGTFKDNAGTEVVTDVLIFQKKTIEERLKDVQDAEGLELANAALTVAQKRYRELTKIIAKAEKADQPEKRNAAETEQKTVQEDINAAEIRITAEKAQLELIYPNWLRLGTARNPGGDEIEINQYFVENPSMIIGNLKLDRGLYHEKEMVVEMTEDFETRLQDAITSLPADIVTERTERVDETLLDRIVTDERVRHGSVIIENGKMYHAEKQAYGEIIYVEKDEVKPAIIARTARLLKIRDAVRNCFNADLQGAPPMTTDIIRDHLNIHYDDFVKDYGSLHLPANQKLLAGDPDLHLLLALEDYDKNTKQAVKAAIFRESTITSYVPPHRADNMSEAIGITLNEYGKLHVPRIVFLLKKEDEPTTEVFARIEKEFIESGLVYHDPVKEEWITKDEYLAGNVREKHAAALIAAAENPARYQKAAEELFKVIPTDLDYTEIDVELGVSWLDREDVAAFAAQLVSGEAEDFQVSHTRSSGWIIGYSQQGTRHSYTPTTTEILGTNRMNMIDVMQHLLDGRRITVYDKIRVDGSDRQVINVEATDAANAKARDIQENFLDWIWTDDTRRTRLHRRYNDLFRSEIPVKYDGSHLTFPGMAKEIDGIPLELRTNQKNAVWRAVRTGSLLFQHEAGGGKTYLMVAAAMKMKQLGLLNKPAIAALKTNVMEITNDAEKLYPGIKLISTSDQFETKKRKETVSRIGTNNFDLVILTHDHIDRLPMKPETRARHINEQLEELRSVIVASEKNKSQNRLVSRLKTAQENLESRLKDVLTKTKDESYFEETGIDSLFIDEIHYYKSLPVFSMNTDVKGIPTSTSDRAMNMFARAFYLQERSGGRNFFGATGTSITNTVAELHIWQKFFQREKLEQKGIATFDSWMHQFARTVTKLERTATGAYKQVTRLAEFTNVPELVALTGEFMDIYNIPKDGEFKRPTVEYEIVKTNLSADQMDYIQRLQKRAENLKRGERDNMLAISTDARKLSLDERLVLPHAPDRPDSKVNLLVETVLQNIEEKDWRTQMIFAEMGVHDVVFPDIINKLSEKIPRERIINFAKLSDSQRKTAINRLKSGEALVGLGSTKTLGTGVNAQDKLFAIHNLDTHWIPAYDEQRRKRMERDGNIHYELGEAVKSYYYLTTGGFDEIMYQANARKHAFISTIINAEGDPNKVQFRRMKEADGEELSYEEIAAVASGNPLILEQLELQRETEDLQRAEKRHRAAQLRLKDDLRLMTEKIEANQGKIEGLQIDYEVYTKHTSEQEQQAEINKVYNQKLKIELNDWRVAQKELVEQGEIDKAAFASESLERDKAVKDNLLPENTFKARLNGKVLNNRTEAAQELRQSLAYVVNPDKLGEYKGFVIETEVARWFEEKRILLNMRGASGLKYEITFATEEGIFQSMESTLRSIPRAIEKFEDERSVASKNITRIESEIGKPFKHKERLVEAKQELENINFEISIYALSDEEKTEKRALREGIILESDTPTEQTDLNTSTVREPESAENKPTLTAGEILLNDKWEDETTKAKNSKEFLDHYLNAGFGTLVTHLDESGETSYSLRHLVERQEITISLNGTTETALEYLDSLVDEKRFTTPASRDIKQKLDDAYHQIEKMTNQAIPEELDWLKTKARNFEKPDDFVSSLIAQTPLKMASTAGAEETPALGAVSTIVKTHGFANVADFWKKANEEIVAAELKQKVKVFETLLDEEREHVQTNYGGNLAKLDETDPFGGRLNKLEGKPLSNYWWMIDAKGDDQGRVLLNAGGYELVRQTYQSLKINKPKFIGMFNEPDTVEIIMEHLDKMATEKPDYASILGGVAATIGKASRQAEGTVIFIADSRAIAHEDFHAASFIASRGKSLEERHSRFAELVNSPIYKAAKPVLEKEHKTDNNGLCVEELANEFAEENYAKYKATKEEKDEFLKLWFTSFAEKNGILTKKEFKALNEQSRQIRDEAYAAVAVADVSRRIQISQRPAAEYSAETGGQEQETRKPLREISEPESRVKSNSPDNFNPEIKEKNTTFRLGVLAKPIEDETSESGLETDADRKYGLPVVAADGLIKIGDRVNYHVGNAKVLEIKENSEGKLYKLKSYANKDEWWTNSDIKQLDRSGATLEDFQNLARQLPDKEFLTAMTPVHWDRARDYGIGSLVTFWEETTGNKFEEIKTPNRWATLKDGEKMPHSSEKNINNTPPDDLLKPDLGVDISVNSPGINEEPSISTNDYEEIPENIEEMLLKNAGNKLEAAYNFVQIELEEDFGIAAYEQKMKSFGFEMHLTEGEPEMYLPTELKNVFINPDKEIVIFEEIENRLIAYPAAESDLKNIYTSGQRDYETESEISGNLDLSDQTVEITDEPELLKAGVTAADEAVLGKNFEIKFEEIKAKYRQKLGLAEAESAGSELISEPPQPAVIEGGDDLSVLLGQELILRHDVRESEYKLSEWLTEKDFHRVGIDRGSEKDSKVLTSLAELNKEARTLAGNKVLELEKAGLLKTEALEVGKEHSEIVKTLFSELYQTETAAQSAERDQITKALDKAASQKQLALAEKETNWINVQEETKKLSATLGDDAKLVSPKLHPEEIWRWQEKAGFRMDEAGFIELEQLHRQIRIPRSQEALGRLRGVEKMADVTARAETKAFENYENSGIEKATVKVCLKNEKGELLVTQMSLNEADERAEASKTNAKNLFGQSKTAGGEAVKFLFAPIENQINPMSPVAGKLAWFTKPAQTLNYHINPIEIIKYDPGVQVIRAVYNYAKYTKQAFDLDKQAKGEMANANELTEKVKPEITDALGKIKQEHLETAENAGKVLQRAQDALEWESRVRAKESIADEVFASNLSIPGKNMPVRQWKKFGDKAIEIGGQELLKDFQTDMQETNLAEAVGETDSRMVARSIKADVRLADEAKNAIASITKISPTEVELEIKLANLVKFGVADEAAQIAGDALETLGIDAAGAPPIFTPQEELAMRGSIADLETQTAVNLSRILDDPLSAAGNMGNVSNIGNTPSLDFDSMNAGQQQVLEEARQIQTALSEMQNTINVQSLLEQQAQIQMAIPGANQVAADTATNMPTAYTVNQPVMEMSNLEREAIQNMAEAIEKGELAETYTQQQVREAADMEIEAAEIAEFEEGVTLIEGIAAI